MFQLPGYTIMDKIGEGGSSEIFLGLRQENQQHVAMKLLNPRYSGDAGMRMRLAREAKVIGQLRHPNIVKIFQFGEWNNRFYMILEYLGKGSLSNFKELSPRRRLKVMIQVCDGVGYIHSFGIIHRDLKPSNIMFGDDQIPRLVDFGISLFANEDHTRLTHTNMVMGTLSYMSPEQQTSPADVDIRSDIYSIGAILYEIFTGKKPVGRFENPRQLIPGFDPEFEAIILKCLEHDKANRYERVELLQQQLVKLWRKGLFTVDGQATAPLESFDDRIGYWLKKLELGTSTERLDAKTRILQNAVPEDGPQLIKICENSGTEIRAALIPLLGRLKLEDGVPLLLQQLANPYLAKEACVALAQIGSQRGTEPILQLVKKREPYSYGALVPLAVLGDSKHLKYLIPYLESPNFADREAAVKAFEIGDGSKLLKDLKKALVRESDADLKNRLQVIVNRIELKR